MVRAKEIWEKTKIKKRNNKQMHGTPDQTIIENNVFKIYKPNPTLMQSLLSQKFVNFYANFVMSSVSLFFAWIKLQRRCYLQQEKSSCHICFIFVKFICWDRWTHKVTFELWKSTLLACSTVIYNSSSEKCWKRSLRYL